MSIHQFVASAQKRITGFLQHRTLSSPFITNTISYIMGRQKQIVAIYFSGRISKLRKNIFFFFFLKSKNVTFFLNFKHISSPLTKLTKQDRERMIKEIAKKELFSTSILVAHKKNKNKINKNKSHDKRSHLVLIKNISLVHYSQLVLIIFSSFSLLLCTMKNWMILDDNNRPFFQRNGHERVGLWIVGDLFE